MKNIIKITEEDWKESKYRTIEWEQSVNITYWEHDFVKKIYIIKYTK